MKQQNEQTNQAQREAKKQNKHNMAIQHIQTEQAR